jgi:NitT/TauT family transport system ATP-binding protein
MATKTKANNSPPSGGPKAPRTEESFSSARVLCEGLSLGYGEEKVLMDLSFSLGEGESLSIAGSSGCGKTTLLNAIYGLIPARMIEGRVTVSPKGAKKAYVMQNHGLFPWKTTFKNMELPLLLNGTEKKERIKILEPLFEELGLLGLKERYPNELSGGERQRIALGRALATGADLILMDEPFSSLDAITRERLQDSIGELFLKRGLSSILATHSIEEAVFLGDKVIVLSKGPARIAGTFQNPGRREKNFRYKESFFKLVSEIRKTLRGEEGEVG